MQRFRILRWLRSALWLVPLACIAASVVVSFVLLAVDRRHPGLISTRATGNSTSVSTILSTVASSMVTLTALVLTLTTLTVQLSMSQFSPRIVPALLNDKRSQFAFGLFGATFTFAGMAVRGLDEPKGFVPGITVLTSYALTLASIAALFLYMHHSAQKLRVGGLIDFVGDQLVAEMERLPALEPTHGVARPDGDLTVFAECGGVYDELDLDGLLDLATRNSCRITVLPRLGDFVPTTAPVARVQWDEGAARPDIADQVRQRILLTSSRSHTSDPAFGMRKLVDIAERSLASGPFTDPTTSVEAIDRLHDALRQLARRQLPPTEHHDRSGTLRVVVRQLDWSGFVRLAFDEIRLAGAGSPQVARRLRSALEDVLSIAPAERHAPLQRQLDLLDQGVQRAFDLEEDAAAMAYPDAQGIGSGRDVVQNATAHGHVGDTRQ